MSDSQQIERDLLAYLEKEPNLKRADRLTYLRTLFHKHLEVERLEHIVTAQDLLTIVAEAKRQLVKNKMPVRIGNKQLDYAESIHVAVLEAFILYLGKMDLSRKVIRFDYKE